MSDASASDEQLPPLIDVRDTLDAIEREAEADMSDELDAIRATLDRLARNEGTSDSVVNDVEDDVLALRERLSGTADMYAEAVENRIRQYRTARSDASDTLDVADPRLARNGAVVDLSRQQGEVVDVEGVLVNQGDSRAATVLVVFYDEDGDVARKVETRAYGLDAGGRHDVSFPVYVPDDVSYYAIRAVDATDPRAIDGGEPTPDELERERRDEDDDEGRNESGEHSSRENAGDA